MLTPWKNSYGKPRQHIKKQRHDCANKVHIVKSMIFPGVMYECEGWIVKKAEYQITGACELWCWWRLLRVPWTARSNQWILKEISSDYSLEGLMLRVKFQYFVMWTADSLEKPWCWEWLKVEWEGSSRGWDGLMVSSNEWTKVWASCGDLVVDRETWHAVVHGVTKSQTWLSDCTELNWTE